VQHNDHDSYRDTHESPRFFNIDINIAIPRDIPVPI